MTPRRSHDSGDDGPDDGTAATSGPATVVDARGVRCPMPVIMIARAAATLPGGSLVTVRATDPAARHDVPAWARMRGHVVVDGPTRTRSDEIRITVRLSGHG